MSIDEAKDYFGEDVCDLVIKIYDFCRKNGYRIYQHVTDQEYADDIMKRGFICETGKIDSIPKEVLKNKPSGYETNEEGVKIEIYDGGQSEWRVHRSKDELMDTQHFVSNEPCNLDFGILTDPPVSRNGFGATCIFVVSEDFKGSREFIQYGVVESHYDDFEEVEVPETYIKRYVIPKQFCIGYLDVDNRRFVANPDFQFDYGVTDKFALSIMTQQQRDLSVDLNNNIGKKM